MFPPAHNTPPPTNSPLPSQTFSFSTTSLVPEDFFQTNPEIVVQYEAHRAQLQTQNLQVEIPTQQERPVVSPGYWYRQTQPIQTTFKSNFETLPVRTIPSRQATPKLYPEYAAFIKDFEKIRKEKALAQRELMEMRENLLKERESQLDAMMRLFRQHSMSVNSERTAIQTKQHTVNSTQRQTQHTFEDSLDSSVAWVYPQQPNQENKTFTKPNIVEVFKAPITHTQPPKKSSTVPNILRALDDILNRTRG